MIVLDRLRHWLGSVPQVVSTVVQWLIIGVMTLLLAAMCGCSRKVIQVPVYIRDSTATVKEVHDSTYIDRWHTEYIKGDTVVIRDSVDRWHSVFLHDTVREVCEIPVEVPVEVPVEKPLTWWQHTKQGGFWVLLVLVGGYLAVRRLRKAF